jgi:transcriptional regulator with XRE-family HTH domain
MTNAQREQLAAAIRAARRSKGLTQEALAERINRTSASLSNLERAQSLPSLETLVLIAEALDVPISSLLDFPATRGKTRSRIREENEIMDQRTAIPELVEGIQAGERDQVLLGVTGSGKTFTMAKSSRRPSARR